MTAVFRSCLPRFYSNTNQSVISEHLSTKTNSIVSLDNEYDDEEEEFDDNSMDCSSSLNEKLISNTPNVRSCAATTQLQRFPGDEANKAIDFQCRCSQAALPKTKAPVDRSKRNRAKSNSSMPGGKRSCRDSPMPEKSQPLLSRLVGSIFGDYQAGGDQQNTVGKKKKQQPRRVKHTPAKTLPPSPATIKKQFKENEQNLRSLLALLTQIESDVKLTVTPPTSTTSIEKEQEPVIAGEQQDERVTIALDTMKIGENKINNLPTDVSINEQARNNNRMDDSSSAHSHDNDDKCYHHHHRRRKSNKHNRNNHHSSSSKRYGEGPSTKKSSRKSHRRTVVIHDDTNDDDDNNSMSITSHHSSSGKIVRRKMVDNQQQTQLRPIKITTATSTQFSPCSKNNNTTQTTTLEPSWIDIMREDQATINAWARIRRRLKPNQQKDILRALMVICANLFEVPIGSKQNEHV